MGKKKKGGRQHDHQEPDPIAIDTPPSNPNPPTAYYDSSENEHETEDVAPIEAVIHDREDDSEGVFELEVETVMKPTSQPAFPPIQSIQATPQPLIIDPQPSILSSSTLSKPPRVRVHKPLRLESDPSSQPIPVSLTQISFNPNIKQPHNSSPSSHENCSAGVVPSNLANVPNNKRRAKSRQITQPSLMSQFGSLVKGSLGPSPGTSPVNPATVANDFSGPETILCAKFVNMTWWDSFPNGCGKNISSVTDDGSLCLLLGYENGFQIWSVSATSGLDVSQLVSVRSGMSRIVDLDVVPCPSGEIQRENISQTVIDVAPLIVAVELPHETTDAMQQVKIYSLKTQTVIANWSYKEQIMSVKACDKLIVVALSNYTLQVHSSLTLNLITTINDSHPVFTVGSRLLIYASTTKAAKPSKLTDSDVSGDEFDEYKSKHHLSFSSTVQEKAMEGLKKTTKKVVKEVIVGAGYLGNVGYTAVSNYLYPAPVSSGSTVPAANRSVSNQSSQTQQQQQQQQDSNPNGEKRAEGTIVILDFPPSLHFPPSEDPSTTLEPSLISHWKPHTNKLQNLTINNAGTLLFTSSTAANTFYIFEIQVPSISGTRASSGKLVQQHCLYKLERGYTPATVESVSFSSNGKWCAVSTARGTSHVYPLPPSTRHYGPSQSTTAAEISALNGWSDVKDGTVDAMNEALKALALSGGSGSGVLYPCARVKQAVSFGGIDEDGSEQPQQQQPFGYRALLGVGFLFDRVLAPVYGNKKVGSAGGSGGTMSVSPSLTGFLGGVTDDQVRLFRQRVLSIHPNGFMTLHYLDMHAGTDSVGGNSGSSTAAPGLSPRNRLSSTASPKDFGSFLTSGGQHPASGNIRVSVKDVLQWDVKRCKDWTEAKPVLEMARESAAPWKIGQWSSQIETTTYDTLLFGAPIWMDLTFKMHLYTTADDDKASLDAIAVGADVSDLPAFKKLEIRHEIPKPFGSDSKHFPTMADSCIAPEISSAMKDALDSGSLRNTPVWRRDDVSFDDALVVDEDDDGDGGNGEVGYYDKIMKQYKKGGDDA
ncbi:UNVERIFIED_CONTAM: hypothetical protein HDU68_001224 [Siphonaria sp. JEL0065]|nr:hypothetical protein HDU68_001224 [Siphonaria sp. JEL0065]